MWLIVDSGSTKTDWVVADSAKDYTKIKTGGINPVVQSEEQIRQNIQHELLQKMHGEGLRAESVERIHYYGAGCIPEKTHIIKEVLRQTFANAHTIEVESDLLGAARSLCGRQPGIACILGTGSNSCLYDGNEIVAHTPALGFIIGDEGSGAAMGKAFINGILKGWLPEKLKERFLEERRLDVAGIIEAVYKLPSPNRFLASCSEFVARHMGECPQLREMVEANFDSFICKNILPYLEAENQASQTKLECQNRQQKISDNSSLVINAVGSVAYFYSAELANAVTRRGLKVGRIEKGPLDGLVNFHFNI